MTHEKDAVIERMAEAIVNSGEEWSYKPEEMLKTAEMCYSASPIAELERKLEAALEILETAKEIKYPAIFIDAALDIIRGE